MIDSKLRESIDRYLRKNYTGITREDYPLWKGLEEECSENMPEPATLHSYNSWRRQDMAGRRSESLSDVMKHVGENFQDRLLRLIDERGLTEAEVYKRANMDRKLFSKIRCTPNYRPRKRNVIALAIALELNLDETIDLLGRAEMALSPGSRFDLIIRYCIENGIYDIMEINEILYEYGQPLLESHKERISIDLNTKRK